MIFKEFVHLGIGDTGEGMIRAGIQANFINTKKLVPLNTAAHMSLDFAIKVLGGAGIKTTPPIVTGVRNPWDWRISYYVHWLRALRYQGTFAEFLDQDLGHGFGAPVAMTNYWNRMGCQCAKYVIRFEYFQQDTMAAFADGLGLETRTNMEKNWFPAVYAQWGGAGHAWLENIEQNLRAELYSANPGLAEMVYDMDRELIDQFGYSFDDYYRPPVSPWVEGKLKGSGQLWHTIPTEMGDRR